MKTNTILHSLFGLAAVAVTLTACTGRATPAVVPTAPAAVATSPYVALLDSPIRGLSPEEIRDLEKGAGAGYARTADVNGYPGPRHVLDLGEALGLSEAQRAEFQRRFEAMNAEARQQGAKILRLEAELEHQFRAGTIDEVSLQALVRELGRQYGELRLIHLSYHLTAAQLLTPEQLRLYNELRGYSQAHSHGDSSQHP